MPVYLSHISHVRRSRSLVYVSCMYRVCIFTFAFAALREGVVVAFVCHGHLEEALQRERVRELDS
jgi:hypothetical protein